MTVIPDFLKVPPEVIELDGDDDSTSTRPLRARKRKHLGDMNELDQVIDKVLRRINLPRQISDGADLVKDDMDKLRNYPF